MPITSNANLANSFTNVIANETLQLLRGNVFLSKFSVTPEQKGGVFTKGNTVDFLIDPVFTAQDAGVTDTERTYSTPSQSKISLTLDYFKEVAPKFTDLDQVIADPATTIATYPRAAALALSTAIERQCLLLAINDTSVPVGNEIGTVGTALNYKALVRARTLFAKMDVPADEERFIILPPDKYEELLNDTNLIQAQTIGTGDAIRTGRMVQAAGFTIYESNLLPTNLLATDVVGTGSDILGVAMTKSAFCFGARPLSENMLGNGMAKTVTDAGYSLRFRMFNDPARNQQKMVFDILFGAKVLGRPAAFDGAMKYPVLPILGGI